MNDEELADKLLGLGMSLRVGTSDRETTEYDMHLLCSELVNGDSDV